MKVGWQLEAWVGQFPPPPPLPPHLRLSEDGVEPPRLHEATALCDDLCAWARPAAPKRTLLPAVPELDTQCWIILMIAIFLSSVATFIAMVVVQKCLRSHRANNMRRLPNKRRRPLDGDASSPSSGVGVGGGSADVIENESAEEALKRVVATAQNVYTSREHQRGRATTVVHHHRPEKVVICDNGDDCEEDDEEDEPSSAAYETIDLAQFAGPQQQQHVYQRPRQDHTHPRQFQPHPLRHHRSVAGVESDEN